MRRAWIVGLAGLCVLIFAWVWSGQTPAAEAPPPSKGDCVEIGLWSNGYHTSLSVPAETFPADHPFRRLYPNARWFMIGWGDLAFYRSRGDDVWMGVQALMPGGQSGMHILAGPDRVESWYRAKEVLPIGLSRAGLAGLADYIDASFERTVSGDAAVVAYEQDGYFVRGRKDFHALNVCNHWTVRALRRAGVRANAAFAFTGDMAVKIVGWHAVRGCSGSERTSLGGGESD